MGWWWSNQPPSRNGRRSWRASLPPGAVALAGALGPDCGVQEEILVGEAGEDPAVVPRRVPGRERWFEIDEVAAGQVPDADVSPKPSLEDDADELAPSDGKAVGGERLLAGRGDSLLARLAQRHEL